MGGKKELKRSTICKDVAKRWIVLGKGENKSLTRIKWRCEGTGKGGYFSEHYLCAQAKTRVGEYDTYDHNPTAFSTLIHMTDKEKNKINCNYLIPSSFYGKASLFTLSGYVQFVRL